MKDSLGTVRPKWFVFGRCNYNYLRKRKYRKQEKDRRDEVDH